VQSAPRHVRRILASQEQEARRNLFGLTGAPGRDLALGK
jgi:hypothetical protein